MLWPIKVIHPRIRLIYQTGFLVLAADRGFIGNEEIRDAFASFAENRIIIYFRSQPTLPARA
jgi:hypothetical protein